MRIQHWLHSSYKQGTTDHPRRLQAIQSIGARYTARVHRGHWIQRRVQPALYLPNVSLFKVTVSSTARGKDIAVYKVSRNPRVSDFRQSKRERPNAQLPTSFIYRQLWSTEIRKPLPREDSRTGLHPNPIQKSGLLITCDDRSTIVIKEINRYNDRQDGNTTNLIAVFAKLRQDGRQQPAPRSRHSNSKD